MFKEPNADPTKMTIWFKDGGSLECCDIPTQFIDESGKFLLYWENGTDLKAVNIDNVDRFVIKDAYEPEEDE